MRNLVGRSVEELDTPVLLVDRDRFESNVAQLATYCRHHDVVWRPHSKAHKSPQVAAIQRAAGAIGVTCAKLSEAEIMVEHGVDDVLLANQLTAAGKLERLARLQERARVIGIVDDEKAVGWAAAAARRAGWTIPLLVDIDIGMHRTGVSPGEAVVALANRIADDEGVELVGVMGYEGHVLDVHPPAAKEAACHDALDHLVRARDDLLAAGLPCSVVSAGGTGCYSLTAAYAGITEIQAGGGIFMDAMYRDACHVGEELGFALTILTTVTGKHEAHVVVDAGFKTLSGYHHPPRVLERQDLDFRYLSAEHGVFDVRAGYEGPPLGERMQLLPGYSDSTTCLHDFLVVVRDGRVDDVWEITGRGALT